MDRPHELSAQRSIPRATYRLQFHPGFTFHDALAIVPYLQRLGISDAYASPILKARSGSGHGYDIVDHSLLNPELGGEQAFLPFSDALRAHDMGLLLDVVPNHMGVGPENSWWLDVLEHGPASPYARFFDIDWQPAKPELAGKLLLPILEDQYGVLLEQGRIQLVFANGAFLLDYNAMRLPIAPGAYADILSTALAQLVASLPAEEPDLQELQSIATALSYLPKSNESDAERLAERRRETSVIKRRLATLCERNTPTCDAIAAALAVFNGTPGKPRSFDRLHDLIEAQPYRLAFWRVASEEINYRRFFDINELAAIRVEDPIVFEATHRLVLQLVAEGRVQGLRIDHPDGLWDPPAYFRQLQQAVADDRPQTTDRRRPTADDRPQSANLVERGANGQQSAVSSQLYVVAEKILSEREPLPPDWAVAGTTGYDFLNAANGVFVSRSNEPRMERIYRQFVAPDDPARPPVFDDLVYRTKQQIMETALASEITSLAHQLERINEKNRRYRDFTLQGITGALRAIVANLAVYRTYITSSDQASERDQRYIEQAVRAARRLSPRTPRTLFAFIQQTLLLRNLHEFRTEDRPAVQALVMRFQQITGPVMAKSVEDTAFYSYHRLIALNEVGGAPDQFGISVASFHRLNAERQQHWPHALLAGSTHDTKRSEDVRARINVLSELPDEWQTAATRWAEQNAMHKREVDGHPAPDRNDEYLLYQTLLGTLQMTRSQIVDYRTAAAQSTIYNLQSLRERVLAYMQKATREAKVHTSWINPNEEYDAALQGFVEAILADDSPFWAELVPLAGRVTFFGQINSLAQTLLRLTAPGVPDIYQGTELWDLSLVDPDNRRPVDYAQRVALLDALEQRVAQGDYARLLPELLEQCDDGRIKLYLLRRALELRNRCHELFAQGEYLPLEATGSAREHVCAFARVRGDEAAIVVVPRLVATLIGGAEQMPLGDVWGDTQLVLPPQLVGQHLRNMFSGTELITTEQMALRDVLAQFPVALLERSL